MAGERINPRFITKPFQLWAAWLVALLGLETLFLTAAVKLPEGWQQSALVISAILFVPLFLSVILLLQTRFRPELQEDLYYSKMLSSKTNAVVTISRLSALESKFDSAIKEMMLQVQGIRSVAGAVPIHQDWSTWKIALNIKYPKSSEIKAKFDIEKIPISVTFGQSGLPLKWLIAINQNIPIELVAQLLRVLSAFEFDGFLFWAPVKEAGETEDVYIGSYGHTKYAPFSSEVKDALSSSSDSFQLSKFLLGRAGE